VVHLLYLRSADRADGLQRRRAAKSRRLIHEAVQRRPLFTWIGHRPSHAVRRRSGPGHPHLPC